MTIRISSSRPPAWSAVALTGLLAITACGGESAGSGAVGPDNGADESAAGEPQEGGTLRYAKDSLPADGTDPHVEPSQLSKQIARNVVDSLVAEDEDGQFHPWLAETWDISEDGTEYTFHLREDVTFSDGTPLNAEAVVANFERIIDPETESRQASTLIQPYESSAAVDEHTVVVQLSEPSAPQRTSTRSSPLSTAMSSPAAGASSLPTRSTTTSLSKAHGNTTSSTPPNCWTRQAGTSSTTTATGSTPRVSG